MHLLLQVLAVLIAGWLNRQHQDVIEYLREENRVLREQMVERWNTTAEEPEHLRKRL